MATEARPPTLARSVQKHLGVDTLEEPEVAVWDERLARVPGRDAGCRVHHATPIGV